MKKRLFSEWAKEAPDDERRIDYVLFLRNKIVGRFTSEQFVSGRLMYAFRNYLTIRHIEEHSDYVKAFLTIPLFAYLDLKTELVELSNNFFNSVEIEDWEEIEDEEN